jgi:hypothetical protein
MALGADQLDYGGRYFSWGSAQGVCTPAPQWGSTRAGVEASKFVAALVGPPAPCTSGPGGGLYPPAGGTAASRNILKRLGLRGDD